MAMSFSLRRRNEEGSLNSNCISWRRWSKMRSSCTSSGCPPRPLAKSPSRKSLSFEEWARDFESGCLVHPTYPLVKGRSHYQLIGAQQTCQKPPVSDLLGSPRSYQSNRVTGQSTVVAALASLKMSSTRFCMPRPFPSIFRRPLLGVVTLVMDPD